MKGRAWLLHSTRCAYCWNSKGARNTWLHLGLVKMVKNCKYFSWKWQLLAIIRWRNSMRKSAERKEFAVMQEQDNPNSLPYCVKFQYALAKILFIAGLVVFYLHKHKFIFYPITRNTSCCVHVIIKSFRKVLFPCTFNKLRTSNFSLRRCYTCSAFLFRLCFIFITLFAML